LRVCDQKTGQQRYRVRDLALEHLVAPSSCCPTRALFGLLRANNVACPDNACYVRRGAAGSDNVIDGRERLEAQNAGTVQAPRAVRDAGAAWVVVAVIFTVVQRSTALESNKTALFLLFSNSVHFGVWALAVPVLAALVGRFPLQRGQIIGHGLVLLPFCFAMAFVVSLLYPTLVYFSLSVMGTHYATYPSILRRGVDLFLQMDLLACVLLVSVLHAMRWWRAYRSEQLRGAELESRLANAHLAALRMQLHPHFLFNTLQSIAGLITEDAVIARQMIIALGDFLRLTLEDGTVALRSLNDELEFIRLYIAIEKMRLGDRMAIEYDIAPETGDALLPYLILQPLVENAVQHGAARIARPVVILLRAERRNGDLRLTLENDGPPTSRAFEPGLGISNTLERLRMHYGEAFAFTLTNRSPGSCVANLTIPYQTANDCLGSNVSNGQLSLSSSHR
jgi:two-component system, LytTR family, sensor kinase